MYVLSSLSGNIALGRVHEGAPVWGKPAALLGARAGFSLLSGTWCCYLCVGKTRGQWCGAACISPAALTHGFPQYGENCCLWFLEELLIVLSCWGWRGSQLSVICIRIKHWYFLLVKVECLPPESSCKVLARIGGNIVEHASKTSSWNMSFFLLEFICHLKCVTLIIQSSFKLSYIISYIIMIISSRFLRYELGATCLKLDFYL